MVSGYEVFGIDDGTNYDICHISKPQVSGFSAGALGFHFDSNICNFYIERVSHE